MTEIRNPEHGVVVSVIVPCRNEERTIRSLLQALYEQSYPKQDMEIVIADGMSIDSTCRIIQEFRSEHPDLRIVTVENSHENIPAGLNLAIKASSGEMIVRLDAHSVPYPDYVSHCVQSLRDGKGDNVGGVWEIQPGSPSWQARGIAAAASHPLGVGDAHYRISAIAKLVDTVPFGSFRRQLIEKLGFFDETLLTNEDYEFNVRLRKAGGKVWLNPEIRSVYYARATFQQLARQYWRYGYWKARMLRRYPETIRLRQALPPILVVSLILWLVLSFVYPEVAWIFVIELLSYLLILFVASFHIALKKKDFSLIFSVPLAIAIMHLFWGSAFIWSLLSR